MGIVKRSAWDKTLWDGNNSYRPYRLSEETKSMLYLSPIKKYTWNLRAIQNLSEAP